MGAVLPEVLVGGTGEAMGIVSSGGTDGNTTGKAAGGGAALGLGGSDGGGFPSNVVGFGRKRRGGFPSNGKWKACWAFFQDIQPRAQGGKGCFCDVTVHPIDLVIQGFDSHQKHRDIAAYLIRKRRDILASDLFVQGFDSLRERRDIATYLIRKRCDIFAYLGNGGL